MPTESARLVKLIQRKIGKFKDVCNGIDEDRASCAPEGSWTPKQIVSHVSTRRRLPATRLGHCQKSVPKELLTITAPGGLISHGPCLPT